MLRRGRDGTSFAAFCTRYERESGAVFHSAFFETFVVPNQLAGNDSTGSLPADMIIKIVGLGEICKQLPFGVHPNLNRGQDTRANRTFWCRSVGWEVGDVVHHTTQRQPGERDIPNLWTSLPWLLAKVRSGSHRGRVGGKL